MEFELVKVQSIDEILPILNIASQEKHKNRLNYNIDRIKKRWEHYICFHKLVDHELGGVIAISGVYKYHDKLARVIDRTWVHPYYRSTFIHKNNNMIVRPVIDYFLPYQTEYCRERGMTSFVSIQYPSKTVVLERLIRETDCGYKLLPDFYFTCTHKKYNNKTCWHRIISTGKIDIMCKTSDEMNSFFE